MEVGTKANIDLSIMFEGVNSLFLLLTAKLVSNNIHQKVVVWGTYSIGGLHHSI